MKRLAAFVVLLCLAAGSAGAQTQVTINYGVAQFLVSTAAVFSVPKGMGFWQQEGLDVTPQAADGAGPALQQLIAGRVQMTLTGLPAAMSLINKGAPIRIAASAYASNVFYPVVLADSPIHTIQDFKGKIVGVPSIASTNTIWIKAIVKAYGLDPARDITPVAVGSGASALQALQTHRIDALQSFEAEYDAYEGQGAQLRRFNQLPELEHLSFVQGLMVNDADLKNRPQVIVGLLRGIAKAAVWSRAHLEDAVRLHWKAFPLTKPQGIDEATALHRAADVLGKQLSHYTLPFGLTTPDKVVAARDVLFEFGGLDKKLDPDAYYTAALLKQANDFDAAAVAALPPPK